MTRPRTIAATALSVISGLLLIISDTRGPVGLYEFILQTLPTFVADELVLSTVKTIALVLISISLLGGFLVIAAGYLIYKGHSTTGKLLIGFGAGAGIPWLLLTLYALATAQDALSVVAQHSIMGWIGILTAFAARFMAK